MYLTFCRNDRKHDTGIACLNTTCHIGKDIRTLDDISPGQHAFIATLLSSGDMRRRLLDIGLTPGTRVDCLGKSPLGDPVSFFIRGAVIALRRKDCRNILIASDQQDALSAVHTPNFVQKNLREESSWV